MLQKTYPEGEIGVIVGRFQVHALHEGHRALIESVRARHQKVAIFLGSTPGVLVTRNNPLDLQSRRVMLQEAFPDVEVRSIKDQPSDEGWSEELDRLIEELFEIGSVVLYGSRDGFAPAYSGKHPVVELDERRSTSGTELRRSISHRVRASADFRHGVVYAAHNRHPVAYPAVDIAILRGHEVLLGRKRNDLSGRWRFLGGFVDPRKDDGLEAAARREATEESGGLEFGPLTYVGSLRVEDWRYRNELDAIVTTLFCCEYRWGEARASDDIAEAAWCSLDRLAETLIPEHLPLGEMLTAHLNKEQNRD